MLTLSRPARSLAQLFLADLSNNKDVHRLAADLASKYPGGIHVLVNNAGTLTLRRQHNLDGVEETWAVNVLAPYALTELLLPALKAGAAASGQPSRVVQVGSDAHKLARRLNLEDPCFDKKVNFVGFPGAYAHSKLALLSLTYELAFRLRSEACSSVTVNCIHPGAVNTNLGNSAVWWAGALKRTVGRLFLRSAASGSEGIAALCYESRFASISGVYYVDQGKEGKHAVATLTAPHTSDQVVCKRLQQLCARMTQARQPVVVSPPSSPVAGKAKHADGEPGSPVAGKSKPAAASASGEGPAQPASPPAVPDAPPAPAPVQEAPPPAAAAPPPPDEASDLVKAQNTFATAAQEAVQAATRISESLRAASEAEQAAGGGVDDDDAVQQAMARVDELRSPEEKAALQAAREAEEAKAAAAAAKAQADAQAAAEAAAEEERKEREKAAQAEADRLAEEQRKREAAEEEQRQLDAARAAAEALRVSDEGKDAA